MLSIISHAGYTSSENADNGQDVGLKARQKHKSPRTVMCQYWRPFIDSNFYATSLNLILFHSEMRLYAYVHRKHCYAYDHIGELMKHVA